MPPHKAEPVVMRRPENRREREGKKGEASLGASLPE